MLINYKWLWYLNVRWIGRLLSSGIKKVGPAAVKLAKSETGRAIKKAVGETVARSALGVAEDVVNGENVKQSLKKNLKQGAKTAAMDTIKISANQIKRKLSNAQEQAEPKPKTQKKTKKRAHKNSKKQTGSGIGGSLFDYC